MPRFYVPLPLIIGQTLSLEDATAKHIQVLRLQPGQSVELFNGQGGAYQANILAIERKSVQVQALAFSPVEREAACAIHLFVATPANDRMDWLVEKATELGVASIHPMLTERSVLKLSGTRAEKRRDHWQAIATAACEQSGRNRVPPISLPAPLFACIPQARGSRYCLSLSAAAQRLSDLPRPQINTSITVFSGPEGGLSAAEEAQLTAVGVQSVSLGPRTLRADTAPLAALVWFITLA